MLCTVETSILHHAPLKQFTLARSQVLSGFRLHEVKDIQQSIARHGLLAPITAIERGDTLYVVNGRKRIAALRRMAFEGNLPPALANIPYILATETSEGHRRAPMIVSNRDLYAKVMAGFRDGRSVKDLAEAHKVSRQCIRKIVTLSRLSPVVRAAFFERLIDFGQASAYASIPDPDAQLALLKQLGPFASPADILDGDDTLHPILAA